MIAGGSTSPLRSRLSALAFGLLTPVFFLRAGALIDLGAVAGAPGVVLVLLGAKLAAPDKTVVACVGDGSYMFGVPTAAHWISNKYALPVLYIVLNNSQWGAVAQATRGVYPDGWAVKTKNMPFTDLGPATDYDLAVQAIGGYGEKVTSPDQIPGALERALHAVKVEGRQALLNIIAPPR